MAETVSSPIVQLIRRILDDPRVRDCSDQELLRRFVAEQDAAAFEALLRRHGPMVLDVCRGVLRNETEVEDAFQATFLVLASKAKSVRKAASLASWLHGVAYRVARKAQAQSARRDKHEGRASEGRTVAPAADDLRWGELRQVIHEEVGGLPDRYRAPLVLCYLEGRTQDAAAAQLGLPKGTLKGHLERARALLRARLLRRGFGPAAALLVAGWPAASAGAGVPAALVSSTVKAAAQVAAGGAAAVSANAAALTKGVLDVMFLAKLKVGAAVGLAVGVLVAGLLSLPLAGPAGNGARAAAPDDGKKPAKGRELTETARKLVGTWVGHTDRHGESYTFRADGTFKQVSVVQVRTTQEGTWAFDWDTLPPTLVLKITRSDTREAPVGTVLKHKVVGLDDKKLAFENPNRDPLPWGPPRPTTYTRAKEPPPGGDKPSLKGGTDRRDSPPRDGNEDAEVRCQLKADKAAWAAGDAPTLRCEIENTGKLKRPVHLKEGFHQIEVDGRVYAWAGTVTSVTDPFPPGGKAEIRFTLAEKHWAPLDEKEARVIETERLRLKPGKHAVRVRVGAGDISVNTLVDLTVGPPVRVWSNAVEIEVEAAAGDGKPRRADVLGEWSCDENGLAQVFFTLDLKDDGSFVLTQRDTAVKFEDQTHGAWELGSDRPSVILRKKRWVKDGKAVEGRKEETESMSVTRKDGEWVLNHRNHGTYRKHTAAAAGRRSSDGVNVGQKIEGEATVELTVGEVKHLRTGRSTRADESEPLILVAKAAGAGGDSVHIDVTWEVATRLKRLGVEDPAEHFRGKVVRVRGTVERLTRRPGPAYRIEVKNLDQFEIIRKP